MPWRLLTGASFPSERAHYSSLFATGPPADQSFSPPTAASQHRVRPVAATLCNAPHLQQRTPGLRLEKHGRRRTRRKIETAETRPVRCESTALASGERQARKGVVVVVPSSPRRPRNLQCEGRVDRTTHARSAAQLQHPFDRRPSADCNVHRAELEKAASDVVVRTRNRRRESLPSWGRRRLPCPPNMLGDVDHVPGEHVNHHPRGAVCRRSPKTQPSWARVTGHRACHHGHGHYQSRVQNVTRPGTPWELLRLAEAAAAAAA